MKPVVDARFKAGEFAGTEISMSLRESKFSVQNTMVTARRLRADTPDAWDAWLAGDITYDKAERISRTLGKLVRDNSKALLNAVVVDVAVCTTGELLGRWLNQFVARVEPDEQDERIHPVPLVSNAAARRNTLSIRQPRSVNAVAVPIPHSRVTTRPPIR